MRIRMGRGRAAKAVGIVAAAGLVGWAFESNVTGVEGNGAAQSRMCAQARDAAEDLPEEIRATARETADRACEAGFREPPTVVRTADSAPRPGWISADDLDAPGRRHVEAVASRLPRDGAVTVGGVTLPPGSRRLGYWATDAPTTEAVALADELAKAFPETGLWPVLWDAEDTPDSYAYPSSPTAADGVDVRAAVNRVWSVFHDGEDGLGALARGEGRPAPLPDAPFARLEKAGGLTADNGAAILLVGVRRPADVVAALGMVETEVAPDADLTAIARSWEERFGAVVTHAGPGELAFSVGAPATDGGQKRALAVEQLAFAPEGDTGGVRERARALGRAARGGSTGRQAWFFGWPD